MAYAGNAKVSKAWPAPQWARCTANETDKETRWVIIKALKSGTGETQKIKRRNKKFCEDQSQKRAHRRAMISLGK